jgi:hypothetical protein
MSATITPTSATATALTILLVTLGAFLVYQRGVVLAWAVAFSGVFLLIKTLVQSSKAGLWLSGTTALLSEATVRISS